MLFINRNCSINGYNQPNNKTNDCRNERNEDCILSDYLFVFAQDQEGNQYAEITKVGEDLVKQTEETNKRIEELPQGIKNLGDAFLQERLKAEEFKGVLKDTADTAEQAAPVYRQRLKKHCLTGHVHVKARKRHVQSRK